MKKYLKLENGETVERGNKVEKQIKVEVSYSLGGLNYFNGRAEGRGYYLNVTPIELTTYEEGYQVEGYTLFSGIKKLLVECKRKSPKAEVEAESKVAEAETELIEYILKQNNLKLKV